MPIPQFLRDRLREGQVVPFVGAGVSMRVVDRQTRKPLFPSWRKLLLDAADRLEAEVKTDDANLVRSLVNVASPDFLYAAKRARQSLGAVWYRFLKDALETDFERIDPQSLELARRIWRLGSNLVITTNYDDVLRWACPNQGDLHSWDIEAPVEQAFLLQQRLRRPVVWHLHGHISNVAQLILSPDGYELLYPENNGGDRKVKYEAALNTLHNQIASKSLLFIGFSLDDEHLGFQLRSVQEIYRGAVGPHYAIVREEQAQRVRSLNIEPVAISDFDRSIMTLMTDLEAAAIPKVSAAVSAEPSTPPTAIPDYGPHQPVFYVPFKQKGNEIVGQQQVIEDVRKQLTEGKRTAIGQTAAFRGLGGLGKTQLAIEYAYRYRHEYPNGVIWLNADQNIDAQLIEIVERARWIAPESDHKYKIQIAQQRLRSYSDCLIIFDNLDDRKAIDAYLPEPEANPHILVTSRIDHADFYPVALELLDEKLSRELLLREARREPENEYEESAALGIVKLLEGLPLALELAGAYLGHRRTITFQQYFELLGKDLKGAFPTRVSSFTDHEADLYSTLRLSESLLQEEPHLREVLDLLTWSGSAPMSADLISHLLDIESHGRLAGAFAFGTELRLLQQSQESDSYSLHRLVGEVRRGEIPLEQRREWVDKVCRRLGDWFQDKREDFSQLTKFESEIDHLKKWQENAAHYAPSHSSRLMWLQAYPAYHRGRYFDSRNYLIQAQRLFDQLNGTDLELKANLLNDLAFTNPEVGQMSSVLPSYLQALEIRIGLFGKVHPEIAISLDNVGASYGEQGDLQRALEYSEKALAMRRELFGEHHSEVARSLNSVGGWYGDLGDLQRALASSEQALAMQRELFGNHHPDVATSLSNASKWYGEQGDLQQALEYALQALTIRRELFGEQHPDIATSLNNIGIWYGRQGDLQCALEYSKQSLAMRRVLFGERHSQIAASLNNVGRWYGEQGDLQRALDYAEQALTIRRELFGQKHPDVATSLNNIGTWYVRQGDWQRASEYCEQSLAMRRELFGDRHPQIAISLNDVGSVAGGQGDLRRALEYTKQALSMQRDLFGEKHPHIATSLNNLGRWYLEQGDPRRALEYSELAWKMRCELFGDKHPDIATSLNGISACYGRKGDLRRALEYAEQSLAMRRELFGDHHPAVANSLNSLAHWCVKQGDAKGGLQHSQQALTLYRELFGERHPDTIKTASQVAAGLANLNRRQEAHELIQHYLEVSQPGRARDALKRLQAQVLSQAIRKGFKQPSKDRRRKPKKGRR